MPTRRLLTLHAPLGRLFSDPMITAVQDTLTDYGITSWWISPEELPDVLLMVEVPEDSPLLGEEDQ